MTTTAETTKTGRLSEGRRPAPGSMFEQWHHECVDCGTRYPVLQDWNADYSALVGFISCNGHVITLCPWCRPDSEPFKNGRGK